MGWPTAGVLLPALILLLLEFSSWGSRNGICSKGRFCLDPIHIIRGAEAMPRLFCREGILPEIQ